MPLPLLLLIGLPVEGRPALRYRRPRAKHSVKFVYKHLKFPLASRQHTKLNDVAMQLFLNVNSSNRSAKCPLSPLPTLDSVGPSR